MADLIKTPPLEAIKKILRAAYPSESASNIAQLAQFIIQGKADLPFQLKWNQLESLIAEQKGSNKRAYIQKNSGGFHVFFRPEKSPQTETELREIFSRLHFPFSLDLSNPYIPIRNWISKRRLKAKDPVLSSPIVLIGNGPFEATEFEIFLRSYGISNVLLENQSWNLEYDGQCPLFVIGQTDFLSSAFLSLFMKEYVASSPREISLPLHNPLKWFQKYTNEFGEVVFYRSKALKHPIVMSQEMLMATLFVELKGFYGDWHQYFDSDWDQHRSQHPALKNIDNCLKRTKETEYFPWPKTDIKPSQKSLSKIDRDDGLLAHLGYRVGHNAERRSLRYGILDSAFRLSPIPNTFDFDYREEWGSAESGKRLRKLAETIAAFARNAKRKNNPALLKAIGDWESDLSWLKQTYYDGRFDRQFNWPDTVSF